MEARPPIFTSWLRAGSGVPHLAEKGVGIPEHCGGGMLPRTRGQGRGAG